MPVDDVGEVKRKVGEWMEGRGLSPQQVDSEDNDFQFNGKTEMQIGITILHPKKLFRSILVVSRIELHPAHKALLNELPPDEKADFIWNLKKDLIFAPVAFRMEPSGNEINSIQFTDEISFDEFTEGKLIKAIDNVCKPLIWTAWVFMKRFGQPEKEEHLD